MSYVLYIFDALQKNTHTQNQPLTAIMKCLALALLLCAQLSLLHGACYFKPMKPGATDCEDTVDHTKHAIGSTWRNSRCDTCSCTGCCNLPRPVSFPDDCMMELDKAQCKFRVFKKNDPTQLCPFAGVGK
ncbi:beta-microseminoprotein A1-like [Conger conger]|uniref:beta-microseminoprotein A1-like n=1 Tax=Conger conger TaxID=82655 RepID=UPI002A5ACE66|nr:beta-microseminoprotein A1-like [Conger conger]